MSDHSASIQQCPLCQNFFPRTVTFEGGLCPQCAAVDLHQTFVSQPQDSAARRALRASETAEPDQLIGHQLGVYRIDSLLGAGAMGRVYLAFHRDLERFSALKILPPRLIEEEPHYIERFLEEGKAAASLVHPNIVTTHAIGRERGHYYLEMEFIAGQTLRQLIDAEGALDPLRATAIAARMADGLAFAHQHNILHRDVKPDNLLLSHQGVPKLVDFGLAKRVVLDVAAPPPSRTELVGTPPYMAPELFRGVQPSILSDLYALGVSYFEMLTGQLPFPKRALTQLINDIVTVEIPSPRTINPRVPLEIAEVASRLVDHTIENRPASAWEAFQLLEAILGQAETLETLLAAAFRNYRGVSWQRLQGTDGYRIAVDIPDGRRQTVILQPTSHAIADRLLTITSVCSPAMPHYFETALRLNSEILHGALGIREIDGQPMFVMIDNYPRATVDAEEIRRTVIEVAFRADAVERLLTNSDLH